jgi:hypothetical protein
MWLCRRPGQARESGQRRCSAQHVPGRLRSGERRSRAGRCGGSVQAGSGADARAGLGRGIRRHGYPVGSHRHRHALLPALDADIRLAPVGDQVTVLTMAGSYRPPLGILGQAADRAIRTRIAGATIHNFLGQVAEQIARGGHLRAAEPGQRSLRRNGSCGSCGVTLTWARATVIVAGPSMTRFRSRLATSGRSSASHDIRSRRSRSPSR